MFWHLQSPCRAFVFIILLRFSNRSVLVVLLLLQVPIHDELVDKLTPPETIDAAERREILSELARALKKQGSYALASKKYTQAGDRVRAIKCLVRSGDTKAVIQFASISRNTEIYKLAANYLQQMNWRESVDILKAIILFYTKAKAFLQLAGTVAVVCVFLEFSVEFSVFRIFLSYFLFSVDSRIFRLHIACV